MKKNSLMRISSTGLALALVAICAVSGSVAKYTSTASGSDTATVAAWSFTVEDADIATSDTFTMDLFAMQNANVEQTNGLIAPGTEGSVELNFANKSEVNATYDLALSAVTSDNTLPIKYKMDDGEWTSDISTLSISAEAIAMNDGEANHTLYWMWDYSGDSAIDTQLGINAAKGEAATCVVTATATATQVD